MRIPEKMPAGLSEHEEILWEVAQNANHDSEYDGRVYTYCNHCGLSQENGERHESDCLVLRARRALGVRWTDAVAEEERQHQEMLEAQQQRERAETARKAAKAASLAARLLANEVTCEFCGDKMHKNALANHQAHSHKCLKAQGKPLPPKPERQPIASITAAASVTAKHLYVRQGRKVVPLCTYCKTPMPGAHPNKKFCSNQGLGNCKDAFHNERNPRGFSQS